ncbi:MAG: discoidin domain-containing protein, partial [Candidatus Poribacteria bacterium]|nr:discoidin domain-containing protein [Candidatus Poribacteria bacterium]
MNLKYFLLGGVAVLLGFLLYPRGEEFINQEYVKPLRRLDNEPLHYTDILRTTPIYTTYDLGYVYKIDKVDIQFDNPNESGPKQFDLLVQTDRLKTPFPRVFSYVGSSREYKYSTHSLPIPVEARWIQIVINDWFSDRPRLKNEEFRVGLRHESPSRFLAQEANYNNSADLIKLTDLLVSEDSKWKGARRIEEKVEIDGKTERRISYASPEDVVEVTADLGAVSKIYGFRLTTDGPGNNLKQFRILISSDGEKYSEVYASNILPDETVTDLHLFESSRINPSNSDDLPTGDMISARYVRLQIDNGDWYGSYPELREFEVFTDAYRLPPPSDHKLSNYNALQMHYENLGIDGNNLAPHLVQGFAFDRDTRDENHYFIAPEKVDAGNTPSQLCFAYHYDQVKLRYTGLDPSHLYWVRTTYLGEKGGGRIQNFVLDGFVMHDGRLVPEGKAEIDVFRIPSAAYADGIIELDFNRLAGPNAVVSEISILEARIAPDTDLDATLSHQDIGWAIRVPSEPSSANRVVIDGQLNEWSQLYPLLPDGYDTNANAPVALHVQWDEDNLYIAAVTDRQAAPTENEQPHPIEDEPPTSEDSAVLHLFVDTALRRSPGMYTTSDHHFTFTIFDLEDDQPRVVPAQIHHHLDAIPNSISHHQAIEGAVTKTDVGHILEARIPKSLALSDFHPELEERIGLNYVLENLNNRDNQSRRFAYGTSDLTAPPNRWNVLRLANQISGQVVIIGQHGSATGGETIALTEMDGYNPRSHAMFSAGDILILCVWDTERNTDRNESESITAELRNETMGESRNIVLYESDPAALIDNDPENDRADNSFLFAAKVETRYREQDGEDQDSEAAAKQDNAPAPLLVDGNEVISLTYIDPYYSTTQQNESVKTSTTVKTGTTGTIAITNESGEIIREFELDDTIYVQVQDADLDAIDQATPHEISARLFVPQTPEAEVVKLSYKQNQDAYVGEIVTVYSESPAPGDGVLQSVGKRSVQAVYLDEIQDTGRTNVSVSARADAVVGKTARVQFRPSTNWVARIDYTFFYAGDR